MTETDRAVSPVATAIVFVALVAFVTATIAAVAFATDGTPTTPDNETNRTDTPSRSDKCPSTMTPVVDIEGKTKYCVKDNVDGGNDTPAPAESPKAESEGTYMTDTET